MTTVYTTNIKNSNFSIEDRAQALSLSKVSTPNYRYVTHRLLGMSPEEYSDMEYDLAESGRIIDTESIVATTFKKKRQLILKDGFSIKCENKANLAYIEKRLAEFEFVTGQTFKDFLNEIAENLVNFHNCFILKYRKEESSSGVIRNLPSGKEFKPIAGLFVLASPTIDTATHPKTGRIVKYRHRITEQFSRQFKPDDIYHIFENKRVGMTIGTPPLEAVKDDIIALRTIEQSVENLIYRNAEPWTHIQVGTDDRPARVLGDGTSEIDIYASLVDNMKQTSGAATPHHVNIKSIGAESQALRMEGYLNYFKNRVLIGLGVAELDLGNGSTVSGGSANIVKESLRDDVRALQDTIASFVSNYIFSELLLESPQYVGKFLVAEKDKVQLLFLESDLEKRIKAESHYLNLYQSGMITKEAAIKYTKYNEEDLSEDILPEKASSTGTNKLLRNNIISPKNQHTIKDSVTTKCFDFDFNNFYENITNTFPIDSIPKETFKPIFKKTLEVLVKYGVDTANIFIDNAILDLISRD